MGWAGRGGPESTVIIGWKAQLTDEYRIYGTLRIFENKTFIGPIGVCIKTGSSFEMSFSDIFPLKFRRDGAASGIPV